MTLTGLSWQDVARMINLFYDKNLRGGQEIILLPRYPEKWDARNITFIHVPNDAVGIFWSDDFISHRSTLVYTGRTTVYSTACTYHGENTEFAYFRKQMSWHFMAEGDLTEITVSDFPEKGEDCTRFTATRQDNDLWSATLEAGPGANPIYREAFERLANKSAVPA